MAGARVGGAFRWVLGTLEAAVEAAVLSGCREVNNADGMSRPWRDTNLRAENVPSNGPVSVKGSDFVVEIQNTKRILGPDSFEGKFS